MTQSGHSRLTGGGFPALSWAGGRPPSLVEAIRPKLIVPLPIGQNERNATRLFVIAYTATLVGNADHEGLLWNGLGRSRLRELVVHGVNSALRRTFNRVEDSLPEGVV